MSLTTPSRPRVQAFLDDLAQLSAKHGVALVAVSGDTLRLVDTPRWMGGYEAIPATPTSLAMASDPTYPTYGYILDAYVAGVTCDTQDKATIVGAPMVAPRT